MFRTLIYPSSGARDCVDGLPHRSSCSQFVVCWSFGCGWFLVVLQAPACKTNTTKKQPHQNFWNKISVGTWRCCSSFDHWTRRLAERFVRFVMLIPFDLEVKPTVRLLLFFHQHSRELLMMDILMSETCWAHNKWNKIASDIKLVFHSSTIAMMHGPINIGFTLRSLKHLILLFFFYICNTWNQVSPLPTKYTHWFAECLNLPGGKTPAADMCNTAWRIKQACFVWASLSPLTQGPLCRL